MTNKIALLFDTETTGPNSLADPADPNNSKVVQLFAGLYEYDDEKQYVHLDNHDQLLGANIRPKALISLIINQDVDVPLGAYRVHGIDRDAQRRYGVNMDGAAYVFCDMVNCADELVAHNIRFDTGIMNHLLHSQEMPVDLNEKTQICTMKLMTPVCKLPPVKRGEYKWPKLEEAYQWMFGRTFANAHDASADTLACAEVFFGYRYLHSIGKA